MLAGNFHDVTHNFFILFCAIISNSNNNPKPTMNANTNASHEGSRGGANDPDVLKAQEDVTKLFDAPKIDEAAIQAAMERLRVAIERRDLVRRMKARCGTMNANTNASRFYDAARPAARPALAERGRRAPQDGF
jgi:hypothetical protein